MHQYMRKTPRRAVVALEAALVYPVMLFLLLGVVIGGIGVFRYQQVACQAREAARWASVRGSDFQRDTDVPSPTTQQIIQEAVWPMSEGMDNQELTVQVQWIDQATNTAGDWDVSSKDVRSITSSGEYVTNTVRVTVRYRWSPNFLGLGSLYLKSTSELPMAF